MVSLLRASMYEGANVNTTEISMTKQRRRKVARTFRLTPGKVEDAQRILGVPTATEAVESALDLVVFGHELVEGFALLTGSSLRLIGLVDGDHARDPASATGCGPILLRV